MYYKNSSVDTLSTAICRRMLSDIVLYCYQSKIRIELFFFFLSPTRECFEKQAHLHAYECTFVQFENLLSVERDN